MATDAKIALYSTTLVATTANLTISGIPSTYRDLRLIINGSFTGDSGTTIRFNGDGGNNYSEVSANARFGNAIDSGSSTSSSLFGDYVNGGVNFAKIIDIMNYSVTDQHKGALCRSNASTVSTGSTTGVQMHVGRWANNSAITSISAICTSTYTVGTTFTLYGIVG